VVPNAKGRIASQESGGPVLGLYVSGWIKRGPTGIIGTNKPDAGETVESLLADVAAGSVLRPPDPDPGAVERLLGERQPDVVSFDDWRRIDAAETASGAAAGRPRVKLTSVQDALDVIRGTGSS
jgi:ferredoxin--NADP+ reductase